MVLLAGSNSVAIRFSNVELPPFWGAALRFGPAALLFLLIALIWRLPLPSGQALAGAVAFGVLAIGVEMALVYYGMVSVQAGQASVVGAILPLLTVFFAWAHGLERLRWRAIAGSLLVVAGIAVVFVEQLREQAPPLALLALVLGSAAAAEANVVVKHFPAANPVTTNAVAMGVGAAMLLIASALGGETRSMPQLPATWAALAFMVLFGTLAVFSLLLFTIRRWTVSAVSYAFVLLPFVAIALGAWLANERITWPLLLGGAVVLAGVYLGALAPERGPAPAVVAAE